MYDDFVDGGLVIDVVVVDVGVVFFVLVGEFVRYEKRDLVKVGCGKICLILCCCGWIE